MWSGPVCVSHERFRAFDAPLGDDANGLAIPKFDQPHTSLLIYGGHAWFCFSLNLLFHIQISASIAYINLNPFSTPVSF